MHHSHPLPTKHQPHNTNTHTSTFKELSFTLVQIHAIYHPFYNTSTLPNTTPINQQNPYNHYTPNHIHYSSQTLSYTLSTQAHTYIYVNNNNLATKTMHTNTTQPPQQTSHKIHQNRHQTNTIHPQHTTGISVLCGSAEFRGWQFEFFIQ